MLRFKKSFFKVCCYRILFFIKRIFVKKENEKYILLSNYNNLGDLVCDTPSLRNIRKSYPNHKIIMLVRNVACVEFMKPCTYVDKVIEMPHSKDHFNNYKQFANKFLKYNFEFSMQFVRPFNEYYRTYLPYMMCIKNRYGLIQMGYEKIYNRAFSNKFFLDNTTTRTEESLRLLTLAGIPIDNDKTECFIDRTKVKTFNFTNYIIIQTCATLESRMWHKNKFIDLINKITSNYKELTILLTGVRKEESYINQIKESCDNKKNIHVVCDVNIATLLNLVKNAKMLITNDTGPFHFAKAFEIPVIAIFGISPPEYIIKEQTKKCIYLRGGSECKANCDCKSKDCINIYKHGRDIHCCINNVTSEDVYSAFEKFSNYL